MNPSQPVSCKDDEAPMYDVCPSDMSVFADAGSTNATVNIANINFTDNVTPPMNLTLNTSHQPRPVLDIGPHIINSTATDSAGLVGYCTYTVTVIGTTTSSCAVKHCSTITCIENSPVCKDHFFT